MLCQQCDARLDHDARFCYKCGAAVGSSSPAYTISNAPMNGPVCSTCGRTNPAGAKFCVYCAANLAQPAPMAGMAAGPVFVQMNTATMPAPQPFVLSVANPGNLILRAVWFVLIGWWLGLIWTIFAWLFNITLIGLPVGLMMLNAIPTVMTLKSRTSRRVSVAPGGNVVVQQPMQQPLPLRALWFVVVGWWASLLWMLIAWSFSATVLLLPIAFWMFNRVPTITTLAAE